MDAGQIQQTLAVFLIGLVIGQALYSPLPASYGRRIGMLLFIIGSAMVALSGSQGILTIARFIQALGAAAALVAPILAPWSGGIVLQVAGWHALFWPLAVFGFIALLWCLFGLPDTLPPERRAKLDGKSVLRAYGRLLLQRDFMVITLTGGLILGSQLTYISASSFIFTGVFSLTLAGVASHCIAAGVLLLATLNGVASLIPFALLIVPAMGALGRVFGDLTALTMQLTKPQAGITSSIMGALQYLLSSINFFIYSKFSFGLEGLPLTMLFCSVIALFLSLKRINKTINIMG
ncbi:major facilitator superfamily transporter (plasmid) [Enterobacter soli]|uniref:MFS transporter n=1 Tax=Enterobacter soli TaxID=885040 RepID=UPI000223CEC8|nr:MFS transporter [Enterobacter soli]AEN67192.1 major facilitator superfamily transporter [Enterobacter soli]OAT35109.1 Bcr/CflA family drug resistance transporter [Enterobacter soli ATCC BAA-2102]